MMLLELVAALMVVVALSLVGFILNSIILVISFSKWKRSRSLLSCDKIYIALGLINILLQCVMTLHLTLYLLDDPLLFNEDLFHTFIILMTFLFYCKIWLNAWLCVHYVISIANCSYSLFVWVKSNFSAILPKLLLVSAVGSFSVSLQCIWNTNVQVQSVSTGNTTINSTSSNLIFDVSPWYQLLAATLGCFFPFIISNLCLGHTLVSLLRHVWRVKHNDSLFSDHILQAHIRAARTMVLLLILYLIYYIAQVVSLIYNNSDRSINVLIYYLVLVAPVTHSIIIIQANSRWRKVFQRRRCIGK